MLYKAQKKKRASKIETRFGWITGFEPATSGTTIQRSNQLSYTHQVNLLIFEWNFHRFGNPYFQSAAKKIFVPKTVNFFQQFQ